MLVGVASASRCNPVTKGIFLFEWIPRHFFLYQRPTEQASIRCVIVSSWLSHQWNKPSPSCALKHLAFHMSSQHFAFCAFQWATAAHEVWVFVPLYKANQVGLSQTVPTK